MKLPIRCFDCTVDQGARGHISLVEFRDDGRYEITCPRGHKTIVVLQEQLFEILFDIGAYAIRDGYYREAVSSFATSLERFHEFFLRSILWYKGIREDVIELSWSLISKQSERQLGAFIILYTADLGLVPSTLDQRHVEFRNRVVHKGAIPSKHEAIEYGQLVLDLVRPSIKILRNRYRAGMQYVIQKHMGNARKEGDQSVGAMHIPTIISLTERGLEYESRPLHQAIVNLVDWETRIN